ncbi:MAG: orotate phosphoribosyltransferase [Planctomycetes bacterium]|nr:orotate phosphoribosyltransferase [Planctomycetota bacterium]
MNQEQVLDLFRRTNAMLEGHFQLSSGRHSDRYFQCALLLADPRKAEQLARAVALKLDVSADLVVGPAMGAVVWAHEVARALGLSSYFTERVNEKFALRRGFSLEAGQRVLVVEDVLTTGGSCREVFEVIRSYGATPVGVASIVNRSGVANPFEQDGLPFTALAEVDVQSWTPEQCPLCASKAHGPALKPGSRPGAVKSV